MMNELPLPLMMLIVFGSATLFAEIFENLNQPGIAGQILAGVLIGPSVLGWVHPNDVMSSLADLGAMFLLFRAGLETRSSELMKIGGSATLIAVSGAALSYGFAWGVLQLSGIRGIEAMFVSASMTATSVGITAQVLSSRGLLEQRASRLILAAAVVDDICGLIALGIVSGIARGSIKFLQIATTIVLTSAFVLIAAIWGTRVMQHLILRARGRLRISEAEFALSACLLFALSAVSIYTGGAAIVGAFLAGLALTETIGTRVQTLVLGATELLVPFFLAGIGLRVNLEALRTPRMAVLALAILAAALASKIAGCGAGALSFGKKEALRVGLGMIPRGEVTMVAAQVGLTMGVIAQSTFGVVVIVAAVTALLAPPFVKLVFEEPQTGELWRGA